MPAARGSTSRACAARGRLARAGSVSGSMRCGVDAGHAGQLPGVTAQETTASSSGRALAPFARGGPHGRAHVPHLQKAAGVAHEAEQQLAPSVQAVCASWYLGLYCYAVARDSKDIPEITRLT